LSGEGIKFSGGERVRVEKDYSPLPFILPKKEKDSFPLKEKNRAEKWQRNLLFPRGFLHLA